MVAILIVAFAGTAYGSIWNYEKDSVQGALMSTSPLAITAGNPTGICYDSKGRTGRIFVSQTYGGWYQYGAAGSGTPQFANKLPVLAAGVISGAAGNVNVGEKYFTMVSQALPAPATTGEGANIYLKWDAVKAGGTGPTPVTANTGSPHGGYLTSTVKCAVCHSSHTAAPGGGPVGSAGAVADTLLRVKAADACGYCHVAAANAVMSPVFGGVWPVPVEAGHSLGGNNCAECHTGPHGVGAETLPALNGKLLTLATDYAPVGSTILSRVAAIEATAVAQGFGADPKVTGYNVAEYSSAAAFAASPAMELQAVGVFCGGCHEGSYASTVANASASNKGGLAAGQFSGHRTMAAATTTWNAAGNKKSSGYQANIKIADAPAQDCYSCHDADNGFGEKAFPHNWGVPAGETLVYDSGLNEFENQTFAWLLRAPDSSGPKTGVDASGKTAHVSATGGTLSDGVCLKCHKWTAGGVGQTF